MVYIPFKSYQPVVPGLIKNRGFFDQVKPLYRRSPVFIGVENSNYQILIDLQ